MIYCIRSHQILSTVINFETPKSNHNLLQDSILLDINFNYISHLKWWCYESYMGWYLITCHLHNLYLQQFAWIAICAFELALRGSCLLSVLAHNRMVNSHENRWGKSQSFSRTIPTIFGRASVGELVMTIMLSHTMFVLFIISIYINLASACLMVIMLSQ